MYSARDTLAGGFPHSDICGYNACLPAHRSFTQAATSFIAYDRQGIHHMHLVAWSYNGAALRRATLFQVTMLLFSVVAESSNAITTRYQPSPGSSPGAGLKRFASSELLKIETAMWF
jgi:hypothetical protein